VRLVELAAWTFALYRSRLTLTRLTATEACASQSARSGLRFNDTQMCVLIPELYNVDARQAGRGKNPLPHTRKGSDRCPRLRQRFCMRWVRLRHRAFEEFLWSRCVNSTRRRSQISGAWKDHVLDFSLTTFGMTVKGTLTVEEAAARRGGQLPLAAASSAGKSSNQYERIAEALGVGGSSAGVLFRHG